MGTDTTTMTAPDLPGPDRLDPDGLLAGTAEVYAWAGARGHSFTEEDDLRRRGSTPVPYRAALLDAWLLAGQHDHARLRTIHPEYAGAMLVYKMRGLAGVREFLDALEADVADLTEQRRRSTWQPARATVTR
jgi:hypothetical protein